MIDKAGNLRWGMERIEPTRRPSQSTEPCVHLAKLMRTKPRGVVKLIYMFINMILKQSHKTPLAKEMIKN
jgi:hypothetical protein